MSTDAHTQALQRAHARAHTARVLTGPGNRNAPFGGQSSRYEGSLFQAPKASQWPAPDPAQYAVVDFAAPTYTVGGSSLHNKAARGCLTSTKPSAAPDPGAYYTAKPFVAGPISKPVR